MNSALKPVLPQPGGPQAGGQPSPAKGNVAAVNHAVGHPQGAQNSLHHGTNNLVGQNLTHHAPPPQAPPHAVPSMAPVSANMAQMAQNMSHHGNLSHVTQNSVAPPTTGSPSKPTTSPLSLVQDKVNVSQPLALTRAPEKKESDPSSHANGTIDSVKSGCNTPTSLKPLNPGTNDNQNIAKTSPSTPKPPEKPNVPTTPAKPELTNPVSQVEGSMESQIVNANEQTEKSPVKQTEVKPSPVADSVQVQSDNKPSELANNTNIQDKESTLVKQDITAPENVITESKTEEKKEGDSESPSNVEKKEDTYEELKKDEPTEKPPAIEDKVEDEKVEQKPLKAETKPKSTLKLATVTPAMRKRRQPSPSKGVDGAGSAKKPNDGESTPDTRMKRNRTRVQLYQSPTPELAMATKLSASVGRSTPTKQNADKLISFYKNEYLAVRNAEGGFYVCQAMQNVYRSTRKIKIRWLSQDKSLDPSGETYKPDFYDVTEKDCVLTTLSLSRAPAGGGAQLLKAPEQARANSILQRALRAERAGADTIDLTEEHPDGLDLSLYTDESQLEKKSRKRNSSKSSPRNKQDSADEEKEAPTPVKKARTTPKRNSKSPRTPKPSVTPNKKTNKRKSAGSTPPVAAPSKTATAVTEKLNKMKATPQKRTPAKPKVEKVATPRPVATPVLKTRRTTREIKSSPIVPTPSTSTGKTTRTPRKPPSKK